MRLTIIPQRQLVIFSGQTAQFTCSAVGYPIPTVQWTTEPAETPVMTSSKLRLKNTKKGLLLTLKNTLTTDSGQFSCVARDDDGRTIKKTVALAVYGEKY